MRPYGCLHSYAGTQWLEGRPAARSEGWEAVLASTRIVRDVGSGQYVNLLEGSWPDVLQLNADSQRKIGCHACMDGACKSMMPNVCFNMGI